MHTPSVGFGWVRGLVCGVVCTWVDFRGCCWVRRGTLGRGVVVGGFRGVRWVKMAAVWARSASDTVECNCSQWGAWARLSLGLRFGLGSGWYRTCVASLEPTRWRPVNFGDLRLLLRCFFESTAAVLVTLRPEDTLRLADQLSGDLRLRLARARL